MLSTYQKPEFSADFLTGFQRGFLFMYLQMIDYYNPSFSNKIMGIESILIVSLHQI